MNADLRLSGMGFRVEPFESVRNGRLLRAVQTGALIYTSGQTSSWEGKELKGRVGTDLSLEEGYEAAQFCALNNLRAIKTLRGDLDGIVKFVKVLGMVNTGADFDATPAVINGCTDLLSEVFGEAGLHARSAVGMTLPGNWAVEIEMIVEVGS